MTHARLAGRPVAGGVALVLTTLALALSALTGCTTATNEPVAAQQAAHLGRVAVNDLRVVAISLDGLNPKAIIRLGRDQVPHLYRMVDEGAATFNARAQLEQTVTLPNHTSMVTGRRINADHGGHGVTWNADRPGTTVQRAAGHDVSSVFRVVAAAGGSTSLFSTKTKFSLFSRSWPKAISRTVIREEDDTTLTTLFRQDLLDHRRSFAFLHLGLADQTGHASGWMSAAYLDAVVTLDRLVGQVLTTISTATRLRTSTVVILTADHGGVPGTTDHSDLRRYDNYRVPFIVWGRGVDHANLYALNPTFPNPGTGRPSFGATQPIRNGDLANLATDVLGLGPVPGSLWNKGQRLTWHD